MVNTDGGSMMAQIMDLARSLQAPGGNLKIDYCKGKPSSRLSLPDSSSPLSRIRTDAHDEAELAVIQGKSALVSKGL